MAQGKEYIPNDADRKELEEMWTSTKLMMWILSRRR